MWRSRSNSVVVSAMRAVTRDAAALQVDHQVAAAQRAAGLRVGQLAVGAAQQRLHAAHQLAHAERLDQVVVGADLEADHLVDLVGARRQEQDRRPRLAPPGGRPRSHPCPAADVEQHQVGRDVGQAGDRLLAGRDDHDVIRSRSSATWTPRATAGSSSTIMMVPAIRPLIIARCVPQPRRPPCRPSRPAGRIRPRTWRASTVVRHARTHNSRSPFAPMDLQIRVDPRTVTGKHEAASCRRRRARRVFGKKAGSVPVQLEPRPRPALP